MKKFILSLWLLIFSLSIFGQINIININNIQGNNKDSIDYVKGDILIKFKTISSKNKAVEAVKAQFIRKYKAKVVKRWKIGAEHWKVDTLLPNYNLLNIIDSLNSNPYVEYAEPNYIIKVDVIPNDPDFVNQWALNNTGQNGGTPGADIDAPKAWNITTGDSSIVVGILDTGIDYGHPDLKENIWTNPNEIPGNGIDDDNNGYIDDVHGWDFVNNDNDPMDDNGHGTHVAGIIGAVGNNRIGVAGVAWHVRMMALKFLNSNGQGSMSDAVNAIEYAIANGVKIINNSWGCDMFSQTLYDAIKQADDSGLLFIVAAGNYSRDIDISPYYPSSYNLDNIVSVASTDRNNSLSSFSNWGLTTVDIAAPGSDIYSTFPNNSYVCLSGTSMAAPFVTGAAVLVWTAFPGFSSQQVKQQLMGSGNQLENLSDKVYSGNRLNSYNAVKDTNFIPFLVNKRKLDFGPFIIGSQILAKKVIITNLLNTSICLDSITCSSGYFISSGSTYVQKIDSCIIHKNDSLTVSVVFEPDSAKKYKGEMKLYYKEKGINKALVTYLSGTGFKNGFFVKPGDVYGTWDSLNSPYLITGDIKIPKEHELVIKPGVKVIFLGRYSLKVGEKAKLSARGCAADSIIITAYNTAEGWKQIQFETSGYDDTIQYCRIEYSTPITDPCVNIVNSTPTIIHNTFINNQSNIGVLLFGIPDVDGYIYSRNYSPYEVSDNVFINNAAFAIQIAKADGGLIHDNLMSNNSGGLIITFSNDVSIDHNIIVNNKGPNCIANGIYVQTSNLKIINNVIAFNNRGGIESTYNKDFPYTNYDTSKLYIINNIIWGNTNVFLGDLKGIINKYNCLENWKQGGYGNISANPQFVSPTSHIGLVDKGYLANWHVLKTSPCKNSGSPYTRLNNDSTRSDMGAYGGQGPFPNNEYTYLSGVVGDTIKAGNYLVYNDIIINPNKKLYVEPGTIFSFWGSQIIGEHGAIISVGSINRPIIYKSFDGSPWGGINIYRSPDTSFVSYSEISGSTMGGFLIFQSTAVISNCKIYNNKYNYNNRAAGLNSISFTDLDNSYLYIYNTRIFNNSSCAPWQPGSAGIYSYIGTLHIEDSKISNNFSYGSDIGSGIKLVCSKGTVKNCVISNNTRLAYNDQSTSKGGGGIYAEQSECTIQNSTIVNNYSSNKNCQIFSFVSSNVQLRNCIVWTHDSTGIPFASFEGKVSALYSDILNGFTGAGNISSVPLFKKPSQGDGNRFNGLSAKWGLQPNSPCIDAGLNNYVHSTTDINGNERICDGDCNGTATVDMGAFEYNNFPGKAGPIYGPDSVCQGEKSVAYTIDSIPQATKITWTLSPSNAGTILGTGRSIRIDWDSTFVSRAQLKVYGNNCMGSGAADSLEIQIMASPVANAGADDTICENSTCQLSCTATNQKSILWTTSGDGTFDNDSSSSATYTPGANDKKNGSVNLTLTAISLFSCGINAVDDMTLRIQPLPKKPVKPQGSTTIMLGKDKESDYTLFSIQNNVSYIWYLTPEKAGSITGTDSKGTVVWNSNYTGTTAFVFVKAGNFCDTVSSDSLKISLSPVSVSSQKKGKFIVIAPNPTQGKFTITLNEPKDYQLSILNTTGKIILQKKIKVNQYHHKVTLDLSCFQSGLYYLRFVNGHDVIIRKVIINKPR